MTNDDREHPKAGTYFGRATADAQLEMGHGRFAARERPQIDGSQPTVAPPGQLQSWQRDWPEDQSVFGEPIDAPLPDMTIVGEG